MNENERLTQQIEVLVDTLEEIANCNSHLRCRSCTMLAKAAIGDLRKTEPQQLEFKFDEEM